MKGTSLGEEHLPDLPLRSSQALKKQLLIKKKKLNEGIIMAGKISLVQAG